MTFMAVTLTCYHMICLPSIQITLTEFTYYQNAMIMINQSIGFGLSLNQILLDCEAWTQFKHEDLPIKTHPKFPKDYECQAFWQDHT